MTLTGLGLEVTLTGLRLEVALTGLGFRGSPNRVRVRGWAATLADLGLLRIWFCLGLGLGLG